MSRQITSLILLIAGAPCSASGAQQLCVEVRETAGIQRFSYPVEGQFRLPGDVSAAPRFRLLDGERALAAQFTPLDADNLSGMSRWAVDFNIDLLPGQTRNLVVEYGDDFPPALPASPGLTVRSQNGAVHVAHPSLEFVVPEDLRGLLSAVRIGQDDQLAPGAKGLALHFRDGRQRTCVATARANGVSSERILKAGPLAAAIEFAWVENLPDGKSLPCMVGLDFPLGKSWLRVSLVIDDANDMLSALSAELRLRLESSQQPILADVAANGWTYAALRDSEKLIYRAGPARAAGQDRASDVPWDVSREFQGKVVPYAMPARAGARLAPQGWAHLMDAKRSTAIAVDQFATGAADSMTLSADGHIELRREFAPVEGAGRGKKQFVFWLHFVKFPPQWGAATSPQSMQSPPEVSITPAD